MEKVWWCAPLELFDNNGSTRLNEVVVGEHQEVSECCGTCSCPHSGGNEVFQGSVKGEGGEQVFFLHFEASYVVCMCKGRVGSENERERMCRGENVRRTYHGLLACPPLAPRRSANLQTSSGTLCIRSLQSEGYSSHQFL